ncbi:MAG: hypothetical protein H7A26_08610 [Spirochaetales bacterium]|nr:hypothetical protein [Spirochaetales bacterium]
MIKADVVILRIAGGITAGVSQRRHYPDKRLILVRREGTVLVLRELYFFGTGRA